MNLMRAKLLPPSSSTALTNTLQSSFLWRRQPWSTHLSVAPTSYQKQVETTQYRYHHVQCVGRWSRLVLPRYSSIQQQCQHPHLQLLYQFQSLRWRHGAGSKLGHMKETLDELAHRPEREAAQERRQKKKEKAAAKKSNNKKTKGNNEAPSAAPAASASAGPQRPSDHYDDDDGDDNLDFLKDADKESAHHDDDDDDDDISNEDAEPTLPNIDFVAERMMSYVDRFQESLQSMRSAEPTPEMFDDISVLAYGSPTPLKAVGQVVIVSPTLAQITCFDPSVAKDVQKAIQLSLDQLNPQLEDESSGTIKVPLPRISMELREQTAKQLKQKAEATKQRVRQVRRKAMDVVKQGKDGKLAGISQDEAFASGKDIDALTERVTERLQKLVDEKMQSIMAV